MKKDMRKRKILEEPEEEILEEGVEEEILEEVVEEEIPEEVAEEEILEEVVEVETLEGVEEEQAETLEEVEEVILMEVEMETLGKVVEIVLMKVNLEWVLIPDQVVSWVLRLVVHLLEVSGAEAISEVESLVSTRPQQQTSPEQASPTQVLIEMKWTT